MEFYSTLAHYYDDIFQLNEKAIHLFEEHLPTNNPKSRVLDLAAGSGKEALELVQRGHDVTAIDISAEMVKQMEIKADKDWLQLRSYKRNMNELHLFNDEKFDGILCIGNSFVHLSDTTEMKNTLRNIYELLENDGVFIVQIVNYDRVLAKKAYELPLISNESKGIQFLRNYELKNDKIIFNGELRFPRSDQLETKKISTELVPLKKETLVNLGSEAGFEKYSVLGNFKGDPNTLDSPATIVIFKKEQSS
ncbi:class I SAM-dependent methyltransferase [Bacillus shivajii]|uniref:class I SAM-dependent methyltransferase n=1 Tax=Bacillus shivajii TaxID=1983719 RepID=UPI001CFC31B2|nr:class I SAM-dependent methyltransferase [Bacillus shivajii]UCZ52404.1 class I SAM-dependent methyltransferase [Bacillus shivajii]